MYRQTILQTAIVIKDFESNSSSKPCFEAFLRKEPERIGCRYSHSVFIFVLKTNCYAKTMTRVKGRMK